MRSNTFLNLGAPFLFTWATVLELAQCYIIFGPTVAPYFDRKEGLLAIPCPDSHPWAHANGTQCCKRYPLGNDFGTFLDWYDPESLCHGGNSIPCPSSSNCMTIKEYMDPDYCPMEYPFQIRNACCKVNIRTTEGTCNGDIMGIDDDPECCKSEYLYQPIYCQTFQKKCRSTSTNPDCHWKHTGVFLQDLGDPYTPVREFDGTTYDDGAKVCDSHFECQFECQKVAQCEFYTFHEHTIATVFGRGFCFLKSSTASGTNVHEDKTSGPKYCP